MGSSMGALRLSRKAVFGAEAPKKITGTATEAEELGLISDVPWLDFVAA